MPLLELELAKMPTDVGCWVVWKRDAKEVNHWIPQSVIFVGVKINHLGTKEVCKLAGSTKDDVKFVYNKLTVDPNIRYSTFASTLKNTFDPAAPSLAYALPKFAATVSDVKERVFKKICKIEAKDMLVYCMWDGGMDIETAMSNKIDQNFFVLNIVQYDAPAVVAETPEMDVREGFAKAA